MKQNRIYKNKYNRYGEDAVFVYRGHKLIRMTNNPNGEHNYFI